MPAIDLLDGKCVRLLKGDYSKISNYNNNPLDQINEFKKAGFDYIHIIDLNAAKSGGDENLLLIEEISQIKNIKIQVGGGIRDSKKIERLFSYNVDRVIVGTAAITNNIFKLELKNNFPILGSKPIVFAMSSIFAPGIFWQIFDNWLIKLILVARNELFAYFIISAVILLVSTIFCFFL